MANHGLTFPDFNDDSGGPLFQTNLIFPVPCEFIHKILPRCAVIRPLCDKFGGAVATVESFLEDGMFKGQSKDFLRTFLQMAEEADAARRLR